MMRERDPEQEQRRAKRTPRRNAAWIELAGGGDLIPCVLWDISDGGARVAAPRVSTLPAVFRLLLTKDGSSERLCRVVWRSDKQVGVQFIEGSIADVAQAEAAVAMPAVIPPSGRAPPGSHGGPHTQSVDETDQPRVRVIAGVLLIVAVTTALFVAAL
jgi:hypothetical protein